MGRPSKDASRMRKRRQVEMEDQRRKRMEKNKLRNIQKIMNESPQERENRLSDMRAHF